MKYWFSAFWPAERPVVGLTVNPRPSAPAQVCAGRLVIVPSGLLKQGTGGLPGSVARAVTIFCCSNLRSLGEKGFEVANGLGPAKIELSVKRGTAFCASCLKPSNAPKRNVLSF